MPTLERKTRSRGRSAVPETLARTRRCRRCLASRVVSLLTGRLPSSPLTDLPAHVLALVADALALVGLRRPDLPRLRGDLADELLVDALDDDLVRSGHLEGDA